MIVSSFVSSSPDVNAASLARRLRTPDSTVRSWAEQSRAPKLDDVIRMAPHMPDGLLLPLLMRLAGTRFCVSPGDCSGEARPASPADVHAQCSAVQGELLLAVADGQIDNAEHDQIQRRGHELVRTLRTLRPGRIQPRVSGGR